MNDDMLNMHNEAEQIVIKKLKELGFPDGSLIVDFNISNKTTGQSFIPDITVINPNTSDLLAVIEITTSKIKHKIKRDAERIVRILESSKNKKYSEGYVVTVDDDNEVIFNLVYKDGISYIDDSPPIIKTILFDDLKSRSLIKNSEKSKSEKNEAVDNLKSICKFMAIALCVVVIIDFVLKESYKIELLTSHRMTLLAIAVALAVTPYFQKIKIKDIELERKPLEKG